MSVVWFQAFLQKNGEPRGQLHPLHGFHGRAGEFRFIFNKANCVYVSDAAWRTTIHRSVLDLTSWDFSWRTLFSGWGPCLVLVPHFSIASLDLDSGPELVRLSSLSGIGLLTRSEPEWYQNQSHFQLTAFFLSCLYLEELQWQPCMQSWNSSPDTQN